MINEWNPVESLPKKTRKRRSKKVTAPEELNSEHEEHFDETSNENLEEFSTNEQYCEHHE